MKSTKKHRLVVRVALTSGDQSSTVVLRPQVTAHFQACCIGDYLLKALKLGIEMVLSDTESHQGENWRGNKEGSEIERRIATFLDNDTVSAQVKDAFSTQVLLGWEDAFQGRFSIRWSAISTPENKK